MEEWEQTEEQDSLKAVAAVLGSAKLLRHRDGDVKLLTACCLSDVLRIFAPESPYENETLKMVTLPLTLTLALALTLTLTLALTLTLTLTLKIDR